MKFITNGVGYTGRKTIQMADHVFNLFGLAYRIIDHLIRRPREGGRLVRMVGIEQIYFTAVQALPLIVPIALITGAAMIAQFSVLSGKYDPGKLMVALVIRELGPLFTALIVILRSATSVTIELSYMVVLHEIDAIEMIGIDPIRFICVPRLVGITSAILSLFLIFDLTAILGGYAIIWTFTHFPVANLLPQISKAMTGGDIVVGLVKALCFGVTITVTSIYHGLRPKVRITDLPVATSRAAVECFFFCFAISVLISIIFYL